MVEIAPPIITLRGGEAIEDTEKILRRYRFKKNDADILRPEFYLFKKEGPLLVSVVNFFDAFFNKCMGIAIASYDEERNQRIMSELEKELGVELQELGTEEQAKTFSPIIKFYEKRFSKLVLGYQY